MLHNFLKELYDSHTQLEAIKISALIFNWLKMGFIFKKSQREELIAQRKNVEKSDCITQFFIGRTVFARMMSNSLI